MVVDGWTRLSHHRLFEISISPRLFRKAKHPLSAGNLKCDERATMRHLAAGKLAIADARHGAGNADP